MVARDEDALACDLAETYGIFDLRALPVRTLAVLACGLRENSRIKQALRGDALTVDQTLLALAVDHLATLVWFLSEDGRKNVNRPASVLKMLTAPNREPERANVIYDSGEDFMAARARWIEVRA